MPKVAPGSAEESRDADRIESPTPHRPQKIVVGDVEEVTLVPWGINLPARIDTGADISALDARDLSIKKNIAYFRLGRRYGSLQLRLPIIEWRRVKTAVGSGVRPVVELAVCLGPKFFHTYALLGDRSEMSYPFLVGKNALKGRFIVDASHSKAVRTECPPGVFLGEESASR